MFPLKAFQKAALAALGRAEGAHVLCVAPTGSGKSLIYEIAAAAQGTRTLLITPLVALARQQFARLQSRNIPVSLGAGGTACGPPQSKSGAWIVSPEMLTYPSKILALQWWRPNFLVVDECHCLWEWGDQFRPAFSQIPSLVSSLRLKRSVWLTATLPFDARAHLRSLLKDPLLEIGQFDLPSQLKVCVQQVSWANRVQALAKWLTHLPSHGIIFVPTREATLRVAHLTQALGKNTVIYHGGLSAEERRNTERLIQQKIPDVIVATSAFGMGMDYPHLSYVILWQAPPSLLSLVQIIGRAGRNAFAEGHAIILWDHEDARLLEWTLGNSEKRKKELIDVINYLQTPACRRAGLKFYFDRQTHLENCQNCDYCLNEGRMHPCSA